MWRPPVGVGLRGQDHGVLLRSSDLGVGDRPGLARLREDAVPLHGLEDQVAADDDGRAVGHDEDRLALGVGLLVRVLDEVVRGGGLRNGREDCRLRQGELAEVGDAEIALGGRSHAVALVAVEVLVEVVVHDLLLALVAGRQLLGQPDGLDDLLDLPLVGRAGQHVVRQEAGPDELLGDRGGAAGPARQAVDAGLEDGDRIEAGVLPEGVVLDAGGGIDQDRRQVAVLDERALLLAEPRQLHLAGRVVDDRLLVELDVVEQRLGVGETLAVDGVAADGHDKADEPDQKEGPEEQ